MSFNVLATSLFEKELKALIKKYPSIVSDITKLVSTLKKEPTTGTSLGKDCYKIRMAISAKGKGKSGGARVITCVKVVNNNVYLLSIYDKSDKDSIDDKILTRLIKAI